MQFQTAIVLTLLTSAFAFPTTPVRSTSTSLSRKIEIRLTPSKQSKRDLVTLDVDPSVDLDLLNDLCIGIAVCNPVTVNSNNDD